MPPARWKAKKLKLIEGAITKMTKAHDAWWQQNILEWAEAVQNILTRHADTGMTASSLAPLLDDVGGPGAGLLITGHRTRMGYTDIAAIGGYHPSHWHGNVPKTPSLGAALGADAYIVTYGIDAKFKYDIQIYQWAFHDNKWQSSVNATRIFVKNTARLQSEMRKVFKQLIVLR